MENETTRNDLEAHQVLVASVVLLATMALFVVICVLIWFATLRENPVFWTYAGGYPVLLRDIVQLTFLPLFLGTSACLFLLQMACFAKICASPRFFILESLMLIICWALLGTTGYLAFANNLQNILQGAPLHRHERSKSPH
jgi:hypothetical protein